MAARASPAAPNPSAITANNEDGDLVQRTARLSLHNTAPNSVNIGTKGGLIVGTGGATIKKLQQVTGCEIRVIRDDPIATLKGTEQQRQQAAMMINHILDSRQYLTPLFEGKPCPPDVKMLYVDLLNFAYPHFFFEWSVAKAMIEIEKFVTATRRHGITIKVFLDGARSSDEDLSKWFKTGECTKDSSLHLWMSRRENEVTNGTKNVMENLSWMLGIKMKQLGVPVAYSINEENDTTLASHAYADKASVLSGDRDFLRFDDPVTKRPCELRIFTDFNIDEKTGLLLLESRKETAKDWERMVKGKPRLPVVLPPPPTVDVDDDSNLYANRMYARGASGPLVREIGYNPHTKLRDVRQVVYAACLGEGLPPVMEAFPEWDESTQCVLFKRTPVEPKHDKKLESMLECQDPRKIFEHVFPFEAKNAHQTVLYTPKTWSRHVLACFTNTLELVCTYRKCTGKGEELNFLEEMLKWEAAR